MTVLNIPGVKTFPYTKIIGIENIVFGKNITIDDFVFISARKKIVIGDHVHIACMTSITGGEELELGEFSGTSHGCRIFTATDDFKSWGTGNSSIPEHYRNLIKAPVKIGRFCRIGANSVILPGVTIGEGATIGACSVVTRDLAPWGIYIGNKKIGERDQKGVLETWERFLREST